MTLGSTFVFHFESFQSNVLFLIVFFKDSKSRLFAFGPNYAPWNLCEGRNVMNLEAAREVPLCFALQAQCSGKSEQKRRRVDGRTKEQE